MRTAHYLAAGLLASSLVLTGCNASVTDTTVDEGTTVSSSSEAAVVVESSSSSSSAEAVDAGAAMSVDVDVQ